MCVCGALFVLFQCNVFMVLFFVCNFCTSVLAHICTLALTLSAYFPLSMHRQTRHATIIWFEYVVCLWFYCCFRMIVLSFAKWHVDALVFLSRTCTPNAYTHFHVVMANCVTIWLIVRHMMLFVASTHCKCASPYDGCENVWWILYCICTAGDSFKWTNDAGLRSETKMKEEKQKRQLGKCYKFTMCTGIRFNSETWLSFYWPIFPQTNY